MKTIVSARRPSVSPAGPASAASTPRASTSSLPPAQLNPNQQKPTSNL